MTNNIIYTVAINAADFESGKVLFREYVDSLGVDLSFQDFEHELNNIGRQYSKPCGALLLVTKPGVTIGCAGIRQIDETTAELKRMYIKPEYRGLGIGAELLQCCLKEAKQLSYNKIRLDTLKDMLRAQQLYRAVGFSEIHAYRFNPLEGTIYMEKEL